MQKTELTVQECVCHAYGVIFWHKCPGDLNCPIKKVLPVKLSSVTKTEPLSIIRKHLLWFFKFGKRWIANERFFQNCLFW